MPHPRILPPASDIKAWMLERMNRPGWMAAAVNAKLTYRNSGWPVEYEAAIDEALLEWRPA